MTEGIIVALITGGVTLAGVLIYNSKSQAVTALSPLRLDKLISSLIGALGGAFLVWVASGMPGV